MDAWFASFLPRNDDTASHLTTHKCFPVSIPWDSDDSYNKSGHWISRDYFARKVTNKYLKAIGTYHVWPFIVIVWSRRFKLNAIAILRCGWSGPAQIAIVQASISAPVFVLFWFTIAITICKTLIWIVSKILPWWIWHSCFHLPTILYGFYCAVFFSDANLLIRFQVSDH